MMKKIGIGNFILIIFDILDILVSYAKWKQIILSNKKRANIREFFSFRNAI